MVTDLSDDELYRRLCMLIAEAGYDPKWVNHNGPGERTSALKGPTITNLYLGQPAVPIEVADRAFDLATAGTTKETWRRRSSAFWEVGWNEVALDR